MKKNEKKKSIGHTNRNKGHNAEREYANIFKSLGFSFCITSRLGSRVYDNAKIDLINIPFNIQIKAGVQSSLNVGKELFSMSAMIKVLFPPDDVVHTKPCILIHKKPVVGRKRLPIHDLVFMSREQSGKFDIPEDSIIYRKDFKFEMSSEFKSMVGVTFEDFKNNVIIKRYVDNNNN